MNNQDMTIRIITEEAKEVEASVISLFEIKETGNKYAIYTFNEEDAQSLVKIYASRISEIDGLYNFVSIADSEEWGRIKAIMKYMAKDNSDGSDNGDIELIPASQIKAQMNEPISVNLSETKAAKIGPNYKTGITNNYLNNVKNIAVKSVESEPVVIPSIPVEPTPAPIEVTPVEIPTVEEPTPIEVQPVVDNSAEEEKAPSIEQALEIPVPTPIFEPTPVAEEEFKPLEIPTVEETEEESYELPRSIDFEIPSVNEEMETPSVEIEETKIDVELPKDEAEEKEIPSVDSVLNKASYYQNIEEPEPKRDESNENIIQSIGLEFMKKVSELAEYEKDLNKRNRELDQKERLIAKLEKELAEKDEKLKENNKSNKDKEMELRKFEKELADRDNDLNRRIMEFNKKISMFQQTFETISKVD